MNSEVKEHEINEVIVVEQLPVIREQLELIRNGIQAEVDVALKLECTEDTVKKVKNVRADLKKDFEELEKRRKDVKNKILSPYEAFEKIYKECVTDIFAPADKKLKEKIDEVENGLKEIKRTETVNYFNEYCASLGIDFLSFEQTKINVTLSASKKSLKAQAKEFADKTAEDINFINSHEYAAEVLIEYKNSCSLAKALNIVTTRHKALEEEQERIERMRLESEKKRRTADKVDEAVKEEKKPDEPVRQNNIVQPPKIIPVNTSSDAAEEEKIFELSFIVRGTRKQLKQLKDYLNTEGYDYE